MTTPATLDTERIRIESWLEDGAPDTIADDVRTGLTRRRKELPPKYFYDERGSDLFDQITRVPEYYPTRSERAILNRHASDIVRATAAEELVELGSGMASKTRALLFAMASAGTLRRYVPMDVDETVVGLAAAELVEIFPGMAVHGIAGDFERHLDRIPGGERRLVAFLGGTIGNLHPPERHGFFEAIRGMLGPDDRLLLGTDLVKDTETLEAAYNDAAGVTAEFNRNVLHVINARLGADFDPDSFEHVAVFDPVNSWIEMRLRASGEQVVSIPGAGLDALVIRDGEEIRTEISTKFTREGLSEELAGAGLRLDRFLTDPDGLFGLTVAAPA